MDLQTRAKSAGLWSPQLPEQLGGGGFTLTQASALLEAAGYSLLGPLALNCAAPDEGNVNLLEKVASESQRHRYLRPLARGEVRSCFAMTEPAPGVGSDPRGVTTRATRMAGGWLLTGKKHLITGADGAGFGIVMAATGNGPGDAVTMFLLPTANEGWHLGEHYRTLDAVSVGGHCVVTLADAFVPDEDVLGEVGRGFHYAQVRLAPARLTHCMRWLGAAQRSHDVALARATTRNLFGRTLSDHGMAQALIADNEIELAAARALLRQATWDVEHDRDAGVASSRAKVFISEAVGRIVDRSVQLMGGLGTVHAEGPADGAVARTYADVRAFRIYDGASEVHRMSIAKRAARAAQGNESRAAT
ncbi:MAG: acyl-CoA dehydrogenase [Acidimicrobiaceae bacterium]|nr:acyl-CoA dehydrogenase [Acidimicrobiaceae bacterium]